jgi:hypothetical protein
MLGARVRIRASASALGEALCDLMVERRELDAHALVSLTCRGRALRVVAQYPARHGGRGPVVVLVSQGSRRRIQLPAKAVEVVE